MRALRILAYVHTHPFGSTTPSEVDKESATKIESSINEQFDDVEILFGIHSLQETEAESAIEMRNPTVVEGELRWFGERRTHQLALYDNEFRKQRIELKDI
jgi:hypothetical protein